MNLINRDTDYAIRALRHFALHPDDCFSVPDLAPALRVPAPYLRRILQRLARHGMLRSTRGKGGGFRLGRAADEIPVSEVVEVFQGGLSLAKCCSPANHACPNRATCPLRRLVQEIETYAVDRLSTATIGTLA